MVQKHILCSRHDVGDFHHYVFCFILYDGKWPWQGLLLVLHGLYSKEGMFMQIKIEKAREGIFMVEGSRTTYLVEE